MISFNNKLFCQRFLSFLLMALGKRLIKYSVVLIPTIRIVKFTIHFSTNYNLYAFVCDFIFQSAKNNTISGTISSNRLQYIAICNISIFSIGHIVLYCSSKYCNISIYRYIVSPLYGI